MMKHHGEISAISARWRKSLYNLAKIQKLTNIIAKSVQSRRDLDNLGKMNYILLLKPELVWFRESNDLGTLIQ